MEEAKEAFEKLTSLVNLLAKPAVEKYHFQPEDFENLSDNIVSAQKYLKSNYVFNLRMHSKIASHCLSNCLSDPKNKQFFVQCEEDHEEVCENCQLVPEIVQALEGVLQTLKDSNDMPESLTFEEARFDLHDSHRKIFNLMSHLQRNQVSQTEWEALLHEKRPDRAFCTMDWAMKALPKKFRESTADWYAQSGWSWQLFAYQRCFPDDEGKGQVETNVHTTVLDDKSLQDSQSVLAMLRASILLYKKAHPEVKELWIRSDNAGECESVII